MPPDTTRRARPRRTAPPAVLLPVLLLAALLLPTSTASASVRSLDVRLDGADLHLAFDAPVTRDRAAAAGRSVVAASHEAASSLGPQYLSCEGNGDWSDENGTLWLQYTCGATRDAISWAFRLSPGVRAIVVGNVTERGLHWTRDGAAMAANAPHVVPASYLLHGTMTGATRGTVVTYDDVLTFRHDVGPGGTATVTWSGRVHTLAD